MKEIGGVRHGCGGLGRRGVQSRGGRTGPVPGPCAVTRTPRNRGRIPPLQSGEPER